MFSFLKMCGNHTDICDMSTNLAVAVTRFTLDYIGKLFSGVRPLSEEQTLTKVKY